MVGSLVLLPSPLVGAGAYAVLAEAFRDAGVVTQVAEVPVGIRSGGEVMAAFRGAVSQARPDLVVAHSNAGLVAPAVADGIPVVFMDAALPPPEGEYAMAQPALFGQLASLADDDGLLPVWTGWWDEEDVEPLFPDRGTRVRVEATLPRLPLAYFRSTVRSLSGWEALPCAYLAFGETYAVELARARGLAWPTAEVSGARHLHFLHDPAGVAGRVLELARLATGGAGAGGSV